MKLENYSTAEILGELAKRAADSADPAPAGKEEIQIDVDVDLDGFHEAIDVMERRLTQTLLLMLVARVDDLEERVAEAAETR